jgi:hypothetical protein
MNSLSINSYEELTKYVRGSVARELPLLIIRGSGGSGKTHLVREETGGALWINGRETPADFYCKLYDNPAALVILDDTDGWTKNETMVSILKQAANTEEDKIIQYNTTSSVLGEREQSFVGNHTFILILNKASRTKDDNMSALLTRAVVVDFEPPIKTVVERMRSFAEDREVFNYLSEHAFKVDFSLRLYHLAVGLKASDIDWRKYVRTVFKAENDDASVLDEIRSWPAHERNSEWVRRTGKTVRRLQQLIAESERK